ncbi:hypothetical protein RUND412_009245 [Rhizina undulata]
MSTITRTVRNLFRVGPKAAFWQMMYIGDIKAGTLIGTDRFGNKYYENKDEELPLRTKWVEYKEHEFEPSHIEPGWHAWLHYMVDKPPGIEPVLQHERRPWETPQHIPNLTFTRGAYKPYSTTKPKISAWEAVAKARV